MLIVGWLLGGTVGVGTVLYAFGIGPLVQFFVRITPKSVLARSGWAPVTASRERRIDAADVEDVVGQHAGQSDRPCAIT